METSNRLTREECAIRYPQLKRPGVRTLFLFVNFFLIIMALYQLKPASRSIFIEAVGSKQLPYVWITTALAMAVFIAYYHRLVERVSRFQVVLGTCLVVGLSLILFRFILVHPRPVLAVAFYVFVDIFSVILVEQFWSLTNSIYTTQEGKVWYGMVGTGGLVGGVLGSGFAALLIKHTPLNTPDLALSAAAIIGIIFALTWTMNRFGMYCGVETATVEKPLAGGWQILRHSRYLLLIAGILLLAQLVSPIIEYQFLNTVEGAYPDREARTAFLSYFFGIMGITGIGVNVIVTPLIHRGFGAIAGLILQPLIMMVCSWFFLLQPSLFAGIAAKISDRGLSYSINRASKELLYIPVDSVVIYQAKAWIDMVGYRVFKVAGSLLILLFTQWLPFAAGVAQLSWLSIVICLVWTALIMLVRYDYVMLCEKAA